MSSKLKLFFYIKSKKQFQKLLSKWVFYLCNLNFRRRWLRFKLFKVVYDEEKFKRRRIRAARYPTKPWMRGVEYAKFKKRYQTFLVSDTKRFSRVINNTLNSTNMLVRLTELKTSNAGSNATLKQFEYFQTMLSFNF